MIPFARIVKYGNVPPTPEPIEFSEVLQQQYYNTLYLHTPTNTLYGYGLNSNKQMGISTAPVTSFTVLSTDCKKYWTGVFGSIMIDTSNRIFYSGSSLAFPQSIPSGNTNKWVDVTTYFNDIDIVADDIKSVHIGASTRILLNDGRVACCGHNANAECGTGQLGKISTLQIVPQFGSNVQFMACSVYGTHYINVDKKSYFVGENSNGTSGTNNPNNANIGTHTLTNSNVSHISAYYQTTWWFMENGDVYWCGLNNTGQAGNDSFASGYTLLPVKNNVISGTIDVQSLISPSSLSVQDVGAPIAMYPSSVRNGGINEYGQLGLGSTTPFERTWITMNINILGTYNNVFVVSKDVRSSSILTKDYKLYCCGGLNGDGQRLPDGSYATTSLKLMANMPWY